MERKFLAEIQRREGPDRAAIGGILQPFSDAFKLLFKETVIPSQSESLFRFVGILGIAPTIGLFLFIGVSDFANLSSQFSLLWIMFFLSLSVYPTLLAGWGSNSRYAFLGGVRGVSQFLSYEIGSALALLSVAAWSQSFDITKIEQNQDNLWNIFPLLPAAFVFFIASLAETNRPPFDLVEAESELVGGFHVEFSSFLFAAFVVFENAAIVFFSNLFTILFLGGRYFFGFPNLLIYAIKVSLVVLSIILIRALTPRYTFDKLIEIGWKYLIPFSGLQLLLIIIWNQCIL